MLLAVVYFIVYPVILNMLRARYYLNQAAGVVLPKGHKPVVGILPALIEYVEESKTKQVGFPFTHILQKEYFQGAYSEIPRFVFLHLFQSRMIFVHDLKAIRDLYTTKNVILEKDDAIYD